MMAGPTTHLVPPRRRLHKLLAAQQLLDLRLIPAQAEEVVALKVLVGGQRGDRGGTEGGQMQLRDEGKENSSCPERIGGGTVTVWSRYMCGAAVVHLFPWKQALHLLAK